MFLGLFGVLILTGCASTPAPLAQKYMQRLEKAEVIGQQAGEVKPKSPAKKQTVDTNFFRYRQTRLYKERVQLSQKLINSLGEDTIFTSIDVRKGQTLQSISFELWNTTRRWPEIYLLNHETIPNWNKLTVGQKLRVWTTN